MSAAALPSPGTPGQTRHPESERKSSILRQAGQSAARPYPLSPVIAIPRIMYFWEMTYARSMGPVEMTVAAIRGP